MDPAPVGFNLFGRCAPSHFNNDGSSQNGVRQISKPSHGDRAIGGQFLSLDCFPFDDTSPSDRTAPMARIDDASDIHVLSREGRRWYQFHRKE